MDHQNNTSRLRAGGDSGSRMAVRAALTPLVDLRDDATLVLTNQGAARVWPQLAQHALDFHYNPSTMGGAVPLGLGLALANSSLHIMVISGDGALTMSLGSLITAVATGAANLTIVVLDNGIYEVTGGQKTAASQARVDYVALAEAVGFPSVFAFDEQTSWHEQAATVIASPGPRLISLRVERALAEDLEVTLPPIQKRLAELSQALAQANKG